MTLIRTSYFVPRADASRRGRGVSVRHSEKVPCGTTNTPRKTLSGLHRSQDLPLGFNTAFDRYSAKFYGFSNFLLLNISGLGEGYSGVRAQLLTVPVYAASAVAYVIAAYFMDRYETRYTLMIPAASKATAKLSTR